MLDLNSVTRQVTLSLGGMKFTFLPDIDVALNLDNRYDAFLIKVGSDKVFQLHYGLALNLDLGVPIFDGKKWTYHLVDGKSVIRTRTDLAGVYRLIVANGDFQQGDIYFVGDLWRNKEHRPSLFCYPLVELLIINALSKGRGIMLHACGVNDRGKGYIFTGRSGAGKSTISQLWAASEGVSVLSDERVIVRQHDGRFWVYGTPWYGDAKIASPEAAPLERIFVIEHGTKNQAVPLKRSSAVSELFARSFPTFWDTEGLAFTLAFLEQMTQTIPSCALNFVPDSEVIDFVRCVS